MLACLAVAAAPNPLLLAFFALVLALSFEKSLNVTEAGGPWLPGWCRSDSLYLSAAVSCWLPEVQAACRSCGCRCWPIWPVSALPTVSLTKSRAPARTSSLAAAHLPRPADKEGWSAHGTR